ncbi:hypothetical protein N7492_005574 [Penicillium capsulatum]|uniref:Uncharacterized protein n=1 Tax=Penicillium capsulatum TaxID=69766 RepID=A0A9W9ICQ9_9EURO|nr:hypothetical protein N7492_005574 [Penicillium capsulatum]KAJ6135326.1 hypothetical protein N7512_000486 [Penicillium capsulatum]
MELQADVNPKLALALSTSPVLAKDIYLKFRVGGTKEVHEIGDDEDLDKFNVADTKSNHLRVQAISEQCKVSGTCVDSTKTWDWPPEPTHWHSTSNNAGPEEGPFCADTYIDDIQGTCKLQK